ncbi:HAMP domain-containing sensor histidine kinase [Pseudoalteromonas sp. Of7M-16]|uniref:sensor histidine kinase n=1 Tax=Pseudoalteromonas sp. Of7M-16 TaxID=2917756 RepID=UPI001EF74044|nr:HAMP domain-containing sensor histidine kinase [Pseudoalteromonas sp. Of7M-16]MCG7549921.1 HAMP domain-containing histidine kinase [Pseudoalteromonas sp. Of7M-16]
MMLFKNKRLLNYAQRIKRLRISAILLLLLLLIPLSVLLYFSYQQSQQNRLVEYEKEASNLARVINRKLFRKLSVSNQIPADAFNYYRYIYNPLTKQTQQMLSPLAELNGEQTIRGLVGYFQIDREGNFNSPIWPYAITSNIEDSGQKNQTLEMITRREIATSVYQTIFESNTVKQMLTHGVSAKNSQFNISFDLPEYLIFYRVVEVIDQPVLQGYLVKRAPYLHQQVADVLELRSFDIPMLVTLKEIEKSVADTYFLYSPSTEEPDISQPLDVDVRYKQQFIFETNLHWPYRNYEVVLSSASLPIAQSMIYSLIFNAVMCLAIVSACYGFYRFSVKQLALGEEKVNFISAVSHELKTPLTSIKMYSEMLKSGMVASEQHKGEYYDFICDESERLARLIDNILQLSAFERQQQKVTPEYTPLTVLQDIIRSKTASLTENHHFEQVHIMELAHYERAQAYIEVDAFTQIVINITDNAVKFFESAGIDDPSRRKIEFTFRRHPTHKGMVQLEIRDYGNGISKAQEEKIFELFYRGSSELTRNSKGTGIGLALVRELVLAQQGEVQVQARHPGLAMLISFPMK